MLHAVSAVLVPPDVAVGSVLRVVVSCTVLRHELQAELVEREGDHTRWGACPSLNTTGASRCQVTTTSSSVILRQEPSQTEA